MSLKILPIPAVPDETARVVRLFSSWQPSGGGA
jgi:hypothetical protein